MMKLILVFVGGGIGSVARYVVTNTVKSFLPVAFPYGTLTVNVIGSFFMAILMTLIATKTNIASEQTRLLLAVGFLGGFTTFSSFSMETLTLVNKNEIFLAVANVVANVVLGFIAAYAGLIFVRD